MKSVKVKFEQESREDLNCIYTYIVRDSMYYANKTVNEIIDKTENLAIFPYMGRKIPEYNNQNLRELIYKSYRILYKVNSNIYILNIFHHSRDILNSINISNY
ncbi:MAG: type II toxin-antitoxin system RelE/ParE family toxin [Clostridia bacterium]|nr:type II toxin-antitoxin system RelE/ParE family toxin [Clostridia bacterium]